MHLMVDKKKPADPDVLRARKERRLENEAEYKKLGRYRRRHKERLKDGRDWPLQVDSSGHIDKADVDPDDVRAPLPEDMKAPVGNVDDAMQKLRKEADQLQAFEGDAVPVDPGVLARRRAERAAELDHLNRVMGPTWTEDLVEERLTEAYRVLFRASVSGTGPRAFGNAMPKIVREVSDLVHQAGNKSLRNAIAHRFKELPSIEEVRRANEALGWALTYLRDQDPDLAGFVSLGAMWKAWGAKINRKCRDIGVHRQVFYRDRKEAIKLIVQGLLRDGKAPT